MRNDDAQQFLQDVLGPVPQDSCVEIRIKKNADAKARQEFYTDIRQVDVSRYGPDEHVWFGVALRKAATSTGKADDLTWINCVWADFDNVTDKDGIVLRLKRFNVPPNLIVDSGGGIHAYWRLNRMLDLNNETYRTYVREVVYGLAHVLGADTSVHDLSRVMGVVATYNPGNGKKKVYDPPRERRLLHRDMSTLAKVEDLSGFRRALPASPVAPPVTHVAASAPAGPLPLDQIRVTQRLRDLIEKGWTQGCGYPSRSELDQAVMIAMLRGGHTQAEVMEVFQHPGYKMSEKFFDKAGDGPRYLAVTFQSAQEWIVQTDMKVAEIREKAGHIETKFGKGWNIVFNRPIVALAKLIGEETGYRVSVGEEQRTLRAWDFASNTAFKRVLGIAGSWTGTDRDVQLLITYLENQKPPVRTSLRTIGWHKGEVLFPNAHLSFTNGGLLVKDTDYLYLGKLTSATLEDSPDWPALAAEVLKQIPLLHTRAAIIPVLGWFAATFVAPQVRRLTSDGAFPLMMVFGAAEAGKTTVLELMQRITGVRSPLFRIETLFANTEAMSSTNTVPIVFDEHRRTDLHVYKNNLYSLLRSAYQAGIASRGRPDLSVVRYRLEAPVCVAGETPFRDPALINRTLHVQFDRSGKNEAAKDALAALPLHEFNAGFYRHVVTKDLPLLWGTAAGLLPKALREDTQQLRQRHAWTTVAFGLLLLEPFFSRELIENLISQLQDFRHATDADLIVAPKAVVHEAVRVMIELIRSRRIRDGVDYTIKVNGSDDHRLWFIPAIVLPAIEEYFTRFPTDLPMAKEAILGRMRDDRASGDPLVLDYQEVFKMGTKAARGISLSLEQVEKDMGIPVDHWLQSAIVYADKAP